MRKFHITYACYKAYVRFWQKNNFADSSIVWVKISNFHPDVDGVSLQQHLLLNKVIKFIFDFFLLSFKICFYTCAAIFQQIWRMELWDSTVGAVLLWQSAVSKSGKLSWALCNKCCTIGSVQFLHGLLYIVGQNDFIATIKSDVNVLERNIVLSALCQLS